MANMSEGELVTDVYTNGYGNGHTNGHTNGHANGHITGYDSDEKKPISRTEDPIRYLREEEGQIEGRVSQEVKKLLMRYAPVSQPFNGPIPSVEMLSEYDNLFPGAAERIMTMAEREQALAHQLIALEMRYRNIGLLVSVAVVVATLATAVLFAFKEYYLPAGILSAVTVLAVLAAIVKKRRTRQPAVTDKALADMALASIPTTSLGKTH